MKSRLVCLSVMLILAVSLAIQVGPDAQAATVKDLKVRCDQTEVNGKTEVSAPYVRVQIALASNLTTILASDVFPVKSRSNSPQGKGTGAYSARLDYPSQPEGTLLVVAVGEWDGQRYLLPATMASQNCHGSALPPGPTLPPTPVPTDGAPGPLPTLPPTLVPTDVWPGPTLPPTPIPTLPPAPVTSYWNVTTSLIADTCGGASMGSSFPVSLATDEWGNITLQRFDMLYFLRPAIAYPGYIGQADLGDALYTMDLFFTGPTTFVAYESVTFSWNPGCSWEFDWWGVLIG